MRLGILNPLFNVHQKMLFPTIEKNNIFKSFDNFNYQLSYYYNWKNCNTVKYKFENSNIKFYINQHDNDDPTWRGNNYAVNIKYENNFEITYKLFFNKNVLNYNTPNITFKISPIIYFHNRSDKIIDMYYEFVYNIGKLPSILYYTNYQQDPDTKIWSNIENSVLKDISFINYPNYPDYFYSKMIFDYPNLSFQYSEDNQNWQNLLIIDISDKIEQYIEKKFITVALRGIIEGTDLNNIPIGTVFAGADWIKYENCELYKR